ncbi:MFS general substrate transporter [Pseudovirgaria hyperparasitica]|uniref:MFS general substrate transporter n=1 Tax=Pseudovirgaria hyperparasitica TaxID=470096 RepID=A0A6A6WKS1_9PEZI|nr:MFS general substrate transporter [Pseudovirgaria hyperparasitica]KAF2762778.1 MFS general substrate transporter [Pseudovirgaria hyperparasitica]
MGNNKDVEATLHDQTDLLPRKQLLIVFSVLAVSLLICFIDQNGIGVILPTIARDLNAENTISWAGTSALIANTVFQVLYGRFSDLFGRRIVFVSALVLLAISDLLCGLSQSATMLYIFRGLAGVANGGITSLAMMIVSDIVTLEERGKYQGILGSMVGLGNVLGPVLGAAFAERSTWRGLFYLLCPTSIICAGLSWLLLPHNMPTVNYKETIQKIDFAGLLSGSIAVIFLLIPISGGGSYFAWDSPMVISMLTIGGLSLIAFVLIEWKFAKLPMMPLSLWTNPAVAALLIQNFFFGAVYYAYLYFLPLFYQNALGYSPMRSAVMTFPIVLTQTFFSIASGRYISHFKRYGEVLWSGFFIWTLGSGLTILFDTNFPVVAMVFILMAIGLGSGNTFQPTIVALQAHCSKPQRAVVISNRNFLRSSGGAIALASGAAVLQNVLKSHLPTDLKYLAASTYSTPDYSKFSESQKQQIIASYVAASRAVFIMLAPFMGVCLFACFLVKDKGLTRPDEVAVAQREPADAESGSISNAGREKVDLVTDTANEGGDQISRKSSDSKHSIDGVGIRSHSE